MWWPTDCVCLCQRLEYVCYMYLKPHYHPSLSLSSLPQQPPVLLPLFKKCKTGPVFHKTLKHYIKHQFRADLSFPFDCRDRSLKSKVSVQSQMLKAAKTKSKLNQSTLSQRSWVVCHESRGSVISETKAQDRVHEQ